MTGEDWARLVLVVLNVVQLIGILGLVYGIWLLIDTGVRRTDNGGIVTGPTVDPHHPSCPARGVHARDPEAPTLCVCQARQPRRTR